MLFILFLCLSLIEKEIARSAHVCLIKITQHHHVITPSKLMIRLPSMPCVCVERLSAVHDSAACKTRRDQTTEKRMQVTSDVNQTLKSHPDASECEHNSSQHQTTASVKWVHVNWQLFFLSYTESWNGNIF